MGDSKAFIHIGREIPKKRAVGERVKDFREIYLPMAEDKLKGQAARCMDCGVPFCHSGCPLGNLIPDWNDLAYRGRWREALSALHATNNFPEFTGRLCPAPCEGACVLAINGDAVTIKVIENTIIDRAFAEGWVQAEAPEKRTGRTVAVVGSGPAGLAAAQQLNRAGHSVTVFERDDRIGGLLRYGIPDFKMDKSILDRRLSQMEEEGVCFRTGVHVGADVTAEELRSGFDAVLLSSGALAAREMPVPGRELSGVHLAMEYLTQQNRRLAGDTEAAWGGGEISADGKTVVILGGGDTGADCLGTAHRQGAKEVLQFDINPEPPALRAAANPWPMYPRTTHALKSPAHEEGGMRDWEIRTLGFSGENGKLTTLHGVRVSSVRDKEGRRISTDIPGSEFALPCELALISIGFAHTEHNTLIKDLDVRLTERGNVWTDGDYQSSVPGVFCAGDMRRGASLIVWAIAEGREAAHGVDKYLMGQSRLPLTAYK